MYLHRRTRRPRPGRRRAKNRRIGRPLAHPASKVEFARLLKDQGHTLGEIAAKTSIPKTTLHRYLTPSPPHR